MPVQSTGPLQFTWGRSRIPRVDGEVYPMIFFGPQLRFNSGIPIYEHENEVYGCFESVHNLPRIQQIIHLKSVEEGHTYYMTSLEYDGNPYYQVLFVLVDTCNKKMYSSWICGRAEEASIGNLDPNTFAFDFQTSEPRRVDEYHKKLGAARKAVLAMQS
jgi:hypothetical protein